MNSPEKRVARPRATLVELIGPGGSGKSTLFEAVQDPGVNRVRVPFRKQPIAIVRGLTTGFRIGMARRLGAREMLNLVRNCASVEQGLRVARDLEGLVLVDEGPIRCLRDELCLSQRELEAWLEYADDVIDRVKRLGLQIILVELVVDNDLRRARYGQRNAMRAKDRAVRGGPRERFGAWLDKLVEQKRAGIDTAPAVDALLGRAPTIERRELKLTREAQNDPKVGARQLFDVALSPLTRG